MTKHDDILVSAQWLEDNLNDPSVRIFDCTGSVGEDFVNRGKEKHYDKHHILGAAYLDIASPQGELAGSNALFPFTWPSQKKFEVTMGQKGVSNDSKVILYGGANPDSPNNGAVGISWVTRCWWLMHHFGVNCSILDGGWQKWVKEDRRISSKETTYDSATFHAKLGWEKGLVHKEDVLEAINNDKVCIVDSLSSQSYLGESDKQYGDFGNRKGHITSALNVHFEAVIDPETLCYHSPKKLKEIFTQAGVDIESKIITYCGGGVGATMTGFALKLMAVDMVSIYDASMMEWNNDQTLPMTNPSAG